MIISHSFCLRCNDLIAAHCSLDKLDCWGLSLAPAVHTFTVLRCSCSFGGQGWFLGKLVLIVLSWNILWVWIASSLSRLLSSSSASSFLLNQNSFLLQALEYLWYLLLLQFYSLFCTSDRNFFAKMLLLKFCEIWSKSLPWKPYHANNNGCLENRP